MRPRIEAVPSVAAAPNERWSTDLCRVWAGRDRLGAAFAARDTHAERTAWSLSYDRAAVPLA